MGGVFVASHSPLGGHIATIFESVRQASPLKKFRLGLCGFVVTIVLCAYGFCIADSRE